MNTIIPEKKCTKCGEVKPITEYHKGKRGKFGKRAECKVCSLKRQKEYRASEGGKETMREHQQLEIMKARRREQYATKESREKKRIYQANNRPRINERCRIKRAEHRMEVINAYGGKCACCGENRVEFLAVDHINGGGRQQRKEPGMGGGGLMLYLKRNDWPAGYRILCHNCNMSMGLYGYCPHGNLDEKVEEDWSI